MDEIKTIEVPGLGKTQITNEISEESIQAAYDAASQAPQDIQALTFSEYILSTTAVYPPLSPSKAAGLPRAGMVILVNEAVRLLDLSYDYKEMSAELDPREQLYRAFQIKIARRLSSAIATYAGLPIFDTRLLVRPLLDSLQNVVSPAQDQIQRTIEAIPTHIRHSLRDFGATVSKFVEVIQQQYDKADLDAQAAAPMLVRSGLWFPPSAPQSLLLAVKDIAESDNPSA